MQEEVAEDVDNIKFLGIHITSTLTVSMNISFHLRKSNKNLQKIEEGWTFPESFYEFKNIFIV